MRNRNLLTSGLTWQIGTGNNISFWFDNWLDTTCLKDIPSWHTFSIPWPEAKVNTFITPDLRWNLDLLKTILNDHPIISRIVGIPLLVSEMEDSIN